MTEREYIKYWSSKSPEERLEETERLRLMFLEAHPEFPRRLVKAVQKRKLHDPDPDKEKFDSLLKIFYLNNKEKILKINS